MAAQPDQVTDAQLVVHVAEYHLVRGNLDAAYEVLEPLVSAPPTELVEQAVVGAAWCNLAHAYVRRRELAPAIRATTNARTFIDSIDVWHAEAAVAALQGHTETAQMLWRRIAAAQPNSSAPWLALARISEAAGSPHEAANAYLKAAQIDRAHSTILTIAPRLARIAPPAEDLAATNRVRIAIIGSSTLDQVQSYLEVYCRLVAVIPSFYLGAYDQYVQEILDPTSALYRFEPEVIIVVIHGRAFFPDLYDSQFTMDATARRSGVDVVVKRVRTLLSTLTSRTTATVLFHTFATPQYSPLGVMDRRDEFGQSALFSRLNEGLAECVRQEFPSVYLIDEDRVHGRIGKRHVTDPRLWSLARIGISPLALEALATEYMRVIKALKGRTRKCLVLDLDNTLWGGVIGEDGYAGIAIGQGTPGNAFRAFQEAILSLWQRGVILAINSKNNEQEALDVLRRHPEMILRPHHFAAIRINWCDKSINLKSIANELNIGLDSMVFIDDSSEECHLVRTQLPQVLTIEPPKDPTRYRGMLLEMTDFDTLGLTEEDRHRGQLYAQRRERLEWESGHADNLGSYLADLDIVVEFGIADEFALPRVVQLLNKTNQFNLTSRRHGEATIRLFSDSPKHEIYVARVRDRFGDQGLVGVAILIWEEDVCTIESLLLSCRVLGRGVETAILSALADRVREKQGRILRGIFVPTSKNSLASEFYARNGFALREEHGGVRILEIDVLSHEVAAPPWLTLQVRKEVMMAQAK